MLAAQLRIRPKWQSLQHREKNTPRASAPVVLTEKETMSSGVGATGMSAAIAAAAAAAATAAAAAAASVFLGTKCSWKCFASIALSCIPISMSRLRM